MRKAEIKMHHQLAGWLSQNENGYHFQYAPAYLTTNNPKPISLTLPTQQNGFSSKVLFSFLLPCPVSTPAKASANLL